MNPGYEDCFQAFKFLYGIQNQELVYILDLMFEPYINMQQSLSQVSSLFLFTFLGISIYS